MKEFKDKVLVVTGGSRGIGKAIAVEGAKRGMKIVLNDIDGDQLAKTCEEIKGMGVECIQYKYRRSPRLNRGSGEHLKMLIGGVYNVYCLQRCARCCDWRRKWHR